MEDQKDSEQAINNSTRGMLFGLILGVAVGVALAVALDNMAFMGVGIAIGTVLGAAFSVAEKRQDGREQHGASSDRGRKS